MIVHSESITIVTVSDDQYCVMLAALLKSIEINMIYSASVNVYIVDDGISAVNKIKLKASINSPVSLTFINLNEVVKERSSLPLDSSSFPLNVYIRLFIPYFIPVEIARVIYLDVDMIVKRDLLELWNLDLQGKVVAAVTDRCETIGSSWGGIRNYEALQLNPEAKYFNSGLLVIDVEAWRNSNYTNEILDCISENKAYANFPDQYGLNVVLSGNWLELDQRWNTFAPLAVSDPFIIHFIGIKPIFASYNFNTIYKDEFFNYLKLTKWDDFKILSNRNRLFKKFKNLLVKKFLVLFRRKV